MWNLYRIQMYTVARSDCGAICIKMFLSSCTGNEWDRNKEV